MSDGGKKSDGDPFDGLDWDKELDDWDRSTTAPADPGAKAQVPSQPDPPKTATPESQPARAPSTSRPLYRPPTTGQSSAAGPPALRESPRAAASPRDEDEHQTLIASASSDLLAELEAAGIQRVTKRPRVAQDDASSAAAPVRAAGGERAPDAAPLDLDLGAFEGEDSTASESRDDVMTTAPSVGSVRSASLEAGPKLLTPDVREFDEEEVTQVASRAELRREIDALLSKQASVSKQPTAVDDAPPPSTVEVAEFADPFADAGAVTALEESVDPFASGVADAVSAPNDDASADATSVESAPATPTPPSAPAVSQPPAAAPAISSAPEPFAQVPPIDARAGSVMPPALGDDRPAVSFLGDEVDAWIARAQSIAAGGRLCADRDARARALVVASEVAALAGDRAAALAFAEEAWDAAPGDLLALRQLRQLFAIDGRWDDVAPLLEAESKATGAGATSAVKVHAALMAAEAARLARAAPDEAAQFWSAAIAADPSDVRAHVARAVSTFATGGASAPATDAIVSERASAKALADAIARRAAHGEPVEDTALADLLEALAAIPNTATDRRLSTVALLSPALDRLAEDGPLAGAARWLRAAFHAHDPASRATATTHVRDLPRGADSLEAHFTWGLDANDHAVARAAAESIAATRASASSETALLALRALQPTAGDLEESAQGLARYAETPGVAAIARGLALATGTDVDPAFRTLSPIDVAARVARTLLAGEPMPRGLLAASGPSTRQGVALAGALASTNAGDAFEALRAWVADDGSRETSTAMARVLCALADGDEVRAIWLLREELTASPANASMAEALAAMDPAGASTLLLESATAIADPRRAASIALTVGLLSYRRDDLALAKRAAEVAAAQVEGDVLAGLLADLCARRSGDLERLLEAVRARQSGTRDPVGKAANVVREALLLAMSEAPNASEKTAEAAELLPNDTTVRALVEAMGGDAAASDLDGRVALAARLEGDAKARVLLDAARTSEFRGDFARAAGLADEVIALGHTPTHDAAMRLSARAQAESGSTARLAETLLARAKATSDPGEKREAYAALAELDLRTRNDAVGASMWHRAILELAPAELSSLRCLEQLAIDGADDDALEPVTTSLVAALPLEAREPHAELGARLRLRHEGAAADAIAPYVEAVAGRATPSLWALRTQDALARAKHDDAQSLKASEALLARAERPAEVAALATRAAEAAFRRGDATKASEHLEHALAVDPRHPTALASIAELRRSAGDARGAAEAIEALAATQSVQAHRLEDWHAAALLWLDDVHDEARGRLALEQCAALDAGYADVFDRLAALLRAGAERGALRALYEDRIDAVERADASATTEPTTAGEPDAPTGETLRVDLARALIALGDRDGAREVLEGAQRKSPSNRPAAELAATLAEEDADWPTLERTLTRLAVLAPHEDARAALNLRLADLFEGPLADRAGAERALRAVHAHMPADATILTRLGALYVLMEDGLRAVEMMQLRLALAAEPAARRTLLLEHARLLDRLADDPERALAALEEARAIDPTDLDTLSALAEFYRAHGRADALAATLDSTIADLKHRLADDPANVSTLGAIVRLVELRGDAQDHKLWLAVQRGVLGEPSTLLGADDGASLPELDALLAPAELSPAIRALLERVGEALEKSVPVDLRALKAAKLGVNQPALRAKIDAVARGFGMPEPDVVLSRAMPWLCLPVGAKPFQIVIGDGLMASDDEVARRFCLARAMKLCAAHCAVLVRVAPADLRLFLDALLHHLHPDYPAPEVAADKLEDVTKRLQRFIPKKDEADVRALAASVIREGALSVEALVGAAATWGDRVALLAVGDLSAALRGVAWTLGQKEPPRADDVEGRRQWISENGAARDLVAFAESEAYARARIVAGVGGK